jgi:hypothetical protein
MHAVAVLTVLTGTLMANSTFDEAQASRFAKLALDCVHKQFPNKIAHTLNSPADVKSPRELTPAFYGCYDWHSSVHGHWLLVRLARLFPNASFAASARRALAQSLTPENLAREAEYLKADGRTTFERPYGLAWLLQLAAELKELESDPQAKEWLTAIHSLEQTVIARLTAWLPKLSYPVRTGEHSNTAFAIGLMLDYARITGNKEFGQLVESRSRDFYIKDKNCPVAYEPSGEDFLSPCLAEADAMRRVLAPAEFGSWLTAFLPRIEMEPTRVTDVTDGKLYHLAGLNLSRAWMLEGIVSNLPVDDSRRQPLTALASRLKQAGLESITGDHYEGGHWLGSFAVYLVSGRGVRKGV